MSVTTSVAFAVVALAIVAVVAMYFITILVLPKDETTDTP